MGISTKFRELSLFSGTGGGLLASKWLLGWRTVCYVEWERYCIDVLRARIRDGLLDDAPIWDDARTFDGSPWCGCVDIVTGGDPCQENSNRRRHGKLSARSLGETFLRIVSEVQPSYVLRENPARVRKDAPWTADKFASGLESLGYTAQIVQAGACCVGTDHRRHRLFVFGKMADSDSQYVEKRKTYTESQGQGKTLARGMVVEEQKTTRPRRRRKAHGMACGMDRLKAIGNGQVPLVVATVWDLLTEDTTWIDKEHTNEKDI